MMWKRRTKSVDETRDLGSEVSRVLQPGDVVLMTGTLGAGKTAFVQGVARGLGVIERVTSPTFTLVRQHQCDRTNGISVLHHADLYRTNSLDEIEDLTLSELVAQGGIALIEWGEMGDPLFGDEVWKLSLEVISDDERLLTLTPPPGLDVDLAGWNPQ